MAFRRFSNRSNSSACSLDLRGDACFAHSREYWLLDFSSRRNTIGWDWRLYSANKIPGIRAALTYDSYSAERAVLSNNGQIITMSARVICNESARSIADAYLRETFDPKGRSAGNVAEMDALDSKYKACA
jgi:hypothetical protein